MIEGAKLNVNYKDLIEMLACDINNYNCMMGECENCGDSEGLLNILLKSDETEDMPDNIIFKQWFTVDQAEMVTNKTKRRIPLNPL